MYKEEFQKKQDELVSIYKVIYTIIFRYGIFFVIIAIAFFLTKFILSQDIHIITITDNDAAQKILNVKAFKKHVNEIKGIEDMDVFVGLGTFQLSGSSLLSYNNLIRYHGYTLPRYFLGDISTFNLLSNLSGKQYSREELESFMDKIRKIDNNNALAMQTNEIIPINQDIINTFNLQCLFQAKLYNGLCNDFIGNFINTFMLYDITSDIEGFRKAFTTLVKKEEYTKNICENLIDYSYYSSNTSNDIRSLIKMCPATYYDIFNKFDLFTTVQKQLEAKSIDDIVYADDVINSYKLNSFLQILYQDINTNRTNADRINSYFDFIEEILKEDKIDNLQANMVYDFNNYQLKTILEKPEFAIKLGDQTEVNDLLKRINSINNGNILIGYKGLQYSVNDNIRTKQTTEGTGNQVENYAKTVDKILSQINTFSIETKQISGNQILTKGTLTVKGNGTEPLNISIKIRFEEKSNVLFIKKIDIGNEPDITKTINGLTEKQARSFGDLQQYINTNISLFQKNIIPSGLSFCDNTKALFSGLTYDIQQCDTGQIIGSRNRKNKRIDMTINYQNYIFKSISVSDSDAKIKVDTYLKQPSVIAKYSIINEGNMVNFLKDILDSLDATLINTGNVDFIASNNTIVVVENIKKYLGISINDIAEKGSKIAIGFNMSGVNLIGTYNVSTHTIEELYFKNILLNNKPALIKNTQIILDDNHLTDIKKFIKDPITYFKNKSPENYLLYMKNK